ncbi:branched-chain amino acid transaminase [Micromonospora sp. B11E3]|uniref:branched-chain amino acid transaminase n=1 Tax=Micromonospora sp. B11E3 TaxID=3153562 RepID=UPI00325D8F92
MTDAKVWLDGSLVDWDDAHVHVSAHGLHYGIGFFEGIRCHGTPQGPALFRLTDHLRRLARSAATYMVSLPYTVDDLAEGCRAVIRANGLTDSYLRPIVFLGPGPNPLTAPYRVAIIASPNGPLVGGSKDHGVKAKVSSFQRMPSHVLPPAAKATGQYLNSYLALQEALTSGYDEAIMLNTEGHVTDGYAHNIFVVRDGELRTPTLASGALEGVVRDTVLTIAGEDGIPTRTDVLVRTDLYHADECFLTGTAAGIVPVLNVDGRTVGSGKVGPVTQQLAARYNDLTTGGNTAHADWRELVG